MKHFTVWQVREALAYAAGGGQALHTHNIIVNRARAPRCFVQAVDRGEDIAHLFDLDTPRLTRTARRLGVRVLYIDKEGTPRQHIDLCAGPLRKALALCAGTAPEEGPVMSMADDVRADYPELDTEATDSDGDAPANHAPLWAGPTDPSPAGGITFSLLSRFLCCRERFRLLVVDGLQPLDMWNHRLGYGNFWHTCEQALAANLPWGTALSEAGTQACTSYPLQQQEIVKWWRVCQAQFPVYVNYWATHPDVTGRTPLLQEQSFSVPYALPSGQIVYLRGKWDSVDVIDRGGKLGRAVYLQENKTKGDVRPGQLHQQLSFDLQTMLYLTALTEYRRNPDNPWPVHTASRATIAGVRYNVIRRPLSGGKGTIVRHKPTKSNPAGETTAAYYQRLAGLISADPAYYFMRFRSEVSIGDLLKFQAECLNPLLQQLCDWWAWVSAYSPADPFSSGSSLHWRMPYGIYNVLAEGGSTDFDGYLDSGTTAGLGRATTLFPELA